MSRAWVCYGLATAVLLVGIGLSASTFPGGFDWTNNVISALASRKHNPGGGPLLAVAIASAMPLLWPAATQIASVSSPPSRLIRFGGRSLKVGSIFATLVGLDRLLFFHLSDVVPKGHELIALIAFLACYSGALAAFAGHLRRGGCARLLSMMAIIPLVAVGLIEFLLFLDQRDIGWSGYDWRGTGAPWWRRFALWQWLALALLWSSLAPLLLLARDCRAPHSSKSR